MKQIFKWIGWIFGTLTALFVLGLLAGYLTSSLRLNKTYDVQAARVIVPSDEAAIAEGERQFYTHACIDCHGTNGAGKLVVDDPMVGTVTGANLTPGQGGVGQSFTDADWVLAIRHGIRHDSKALVIMPSYEYNLMNDEDLGNLIAYLKSLPPVNHTPPSPVLGPIGHFLVVSRVYPLLSAEVIDHTAPRPPAVAKGPTADYGHYLASQSCMGCHGEGLSGGPIPGVPAEPPLPRNLTPDKETGLGNWSQEDFVRVLREGVRPDGTTINASNMPWPAFQYLSDDELTALWLYLQSVPAKPYGNR